MRKFDMKRISVVTPCYNEEENVRQIYEAVRQIFSTLKQYQYEYIFIDNASCDGTADILKEVAKTDKNVKVIINTRNFGHIRSPFYGLLQSSGEAAILIAADFQEPPSLIAEFLKKWEGGCKVVFGVKTDSREPRLIFTIRSLYYDMVNKLSTVRLTKNATGFGLYDKAVVDSLRSIDEPYPYLRGLVSELGYQATHVDYIQPTRARGVTKNNFYTLYDMAMLGITNHSRVPLRIATMCGFILSAFSLLVALAYLVAKLLFWNFFTIGIAPLIISLFGFSAMQLFFIGILGEYIGAVLTQVQKRPLVIEKERINF